MIPIEPVGRSAFDRSQRRARPPLQRDRVGAGDARESNRTDTVVAVCDRVAQDASVKRRALMLVSRFENPSRRQRKTRSKTDRAAAPGFERG